MKIGVAIPCYNKHIPQLLSLLDSLEEQTRKPDSVSVSCSSTEEFPTLREYSFPVRVYTTKERQNPAKNRNIAARLLMDTDILSFFDADDTMHPRRLEALEYAFQEPCDIVLHNFLFREETELPYPEIQEFRIQRNQLSQCYSGCIRHQCATMDYNARISHGHVTIRTELFRSVQFPEDASCEHREDCVFCYCIFNLPNVRSVYLGDPLSKYIPSNSWKV